MPATTSTSSSTRSCHHQPLVVAGVQDGTEMTGFHFLCSLPHQDTCTGDVTRSYIYLNLAPSCHCARLEESIIILNGKWKDQRPSSSSLLTPPKSQVASERKKSDALDVPTKRG